MGAAGPSAPAASALSRAFDRRLKQWLDVLILFKTIKTMLSGFGAR